MQCICEGFPPSKWIDDSKYWHTHNIVHYLQVPLVKTVLKMANVQALLVLCLLVIVLAFQVNYNF